jgi:hypothetical protein
MGLAGRRHTRRRLPHRRLHARTPRQHRPRNGSGDDRPASFGVPTVREPVRDAVPAPSPSPALGTGRQDEQHDSRVPSPSPSARPGAGPAPALLDFARRVATEHHQRHGRPITRDALRARLGISNALASELLRHVRTETT